nr:hypothetical protein Itr_chr05CG09540 [Ipomoea trifida]
MGLEGSLMRSRVRLISSRKDGRINQSRTRQEVRQSVKGHRNGALWVNAQAECQVSGDSLGEQGCLDELVSRREGWLIPWWTQANEERLAVHRGDLGRILRSVEENP